MKAERKFSSLSSGNLIATENCLHVLHGENVDFNHRWPKLERHQVLLSFRAEYNAKIPSDIAMKC